MRLTFLPAAAVLLSALPTQAQTIEDCEVIRDPDGFAVVLTKVADPGPALSADIFVGEDPEPTVSAATLVALGQTGVHAWSPTDKDTKALSRFKDAALVRVRSAGASTSCKILGFKNAPALVDATSLRADQTCHSCAAQLACEIFADLHEYPVSRLHCSARVYKFRPWQVVQSLLTYGSTDPGASPPAALAPGPPPECLVMGDEQSHTAVLAKIPMSFGQSELVFDKDGQITEHDFPLTEMPDYANRYYWVPPSDTASEPIPTEIVQIPDTIDLKLDGATVAQCHFKAYTTDVPYNPHVLTGLANATFILVGFIGGKGGCPDCIRQVACSVLDTQYNVSNAASFCGGETWQFTDYELAEDIEGVIDLIPGIPTVQ